MNRVGGLCEAHPLLISHVISLKWQGEIAFVLGPSACHARSRDETLLSVIL